ncbi:LPXTG-motif cell wall-anchored protein/uncharacterized repeat protein (TIGR01451 family) [Tumebacillus sp. BK434]|nr:LPXTG-motif cell wall-anchored protein/uncharacterized repeat protein (TIGR01451 family) [Tumebacillus sp. BK434]
MLIFMLIIQIVAPGSIIAAGETDGLDLNITASKSVVDSGEVFDYKISYSASSNIANFTNPKIRFVVPSGMTFASKSHSAAITSSYNSITKVVTFNFAGNTLPAGSSGELTVRAYFDNYVTPDGTTATTKATFNAEVNGTPVTLDSDDVTVTSNGEARWTIKKTKHRPVPEPYKGANVEYQIELKDNFPTSNGRLNSANMVVTDTLPDDATFVSATQGGTLVGNTVVWNLGDLQKGTYLLNVTVNYPASFPDSTVTNRVEAAFTPLGQPRTSVNGEVTHGFATQPVDNGVLIEKWVDPKLRERSPGQDVTFYISEFNSKANIPLTNAIIEDMTPTHTSAQSTQIVPIDLQLKTVRTAIFKDIPDYDVYYSTKEDLGVWKLWQNVSGTASTTLNVADLSLAASDRVAGVQFRFATVPISAFQSTNFDLVYHIPETFVVPDINTNVENIAKLTYSFNGDTKTMNDNTYVYIVDDRPLLNMEKSSNKKDVRPLDEIEYTLKVTNTEFTSKSLDNPSIVDLLPAQLEYKPGSWSVTTAGVPAPHFTPTAEPDGTTTLNWYWDASNPYILAKGEEVTIKFTAIVKPGAPKGDLINKMQVRSPHYLNDSGFKNMGCKTCGSSGYYTVESQASVSVDETTALQSELLIKGELDNDWSKFPTVGRTTPGGRTMYRLEIQNVGNVPTKNLKIVNKFSRIGDTGVRVSTPRGSQWGPLLTGEVTVPNYVTVAYSTTPNITMDSNGVDTGVWLATPPADLTSVTAIKFQFDPDFIIDPLNMTTLEWPMVAPVGAPTGGEVAWNSFAYKMNKATGESLLASEPLKVGVTILSSPKASIGDFVWYDQNENGVMDGAETGINGIKLELRDADGTKISETMTGNDFNGNPGAYLFPDLDPGDYVVAVVPPAAYEPDKTGVITLADGEQHLNADFPLVPKKAKLGDTVWFDADGDGVQDAGENGVNGVLVSLYNNSGTLLTTTTTATIGGKDGVYLFEKLNPGTYEVRFTLPAPTKAFTTPSTRTVTLAQGEENMAIDAGINDVPSDASIGDFVWEDKNNNGIQDPGENGVNLITVELYDDQNNLIATTVTADRAGASGYYSFENLAAGNYYVKFILPFPATKTMQGADRSVDSDANANGQTNVFALGQSEHLTGIDAGYYKAPVVPPVTPPVVVEPELPKGSIGDRVWIDANKNGVQDADEVGQNGVTVELYNDKNQLIASTVTRTMNGKAGWYQFEKLAAGSYEVRFVLPSATVEFTTPGMGASRSLDSDANPATGRTGLFVLGIGEAKTSIDAGLIELGLPPDKGEEPPKLKLGKIRSFVWFDANANGIHDPSEQGMDGVTVELYDKTGKLIATTKTKMFMGQHGFYEFLDLPKGEYSLKFIVPAGYGLTKDGVGSDPNADSNAKPTGWTAPVTLGEGETNLSIGAGLVKAKNPSPGQPTGQPSQPGKPNTGEGSKPQPAPGGTLPQTGEEPPMLPWVGLALCLLAGGALLYRKYA